MELDKLTYAPGARKNRKRVGRGPASGNGKTAGRGHKGQKSRSGYHRKSGFEGGQMPLNRRLPKRGFYHEKRMPLAVVNVGVLSRYFDDGAEVTQEALLQAGLIKNMRGGVKVLGTGDVDKKLTVKANAITESARQKIEAAGGAVEIVAVSKAPETESAGEAAPAGAEE